MAISDSAKVDLLYKKAFGVAKTDLSTLKSPSNESIASPALLRGDNVWQQATSIPATAAALTGIVQSYNSTSRIQCTADNTSTPISSVYPTWKTGLTDWIPPEFGSTYFVKVYVDNTGASDPSSTGTQIFDAGIGGVGEWNFDYQSGVLNFIGGTIPASLTSSKFIFIMGYRYIGSKGVTAFPNGLTIGNVIISGNTITGNNSSIVSFTDTTAIKLPTGTDLQRPSGATGYIRFNTQAGAPEYYSGSAWVPITNTVTDQTITGDGTNTVYTLSQTATDVGTLVSINGTLQQPGVAYSITGNQITFAEILLPTDIVDVRFLGGVVSISGQLLDDLNVSGNVTLSGILQAPQTTKASNATGTVGQICWDANYIYVCTATNTWKRSPLTGGY